MSLTSCQLSVKAPFAACDRSALHPGSSLSFGHDSGSCDPLRNHDHHRRSRYSAILWMMLPRYRYLDLLTIAFVVVLLVSNLVGPKICKIGPLLVSGAQLLFPVTYICGDVFTEVYGYAAARRAIWLGFFGMGLLTIMGQVAVSLQPAPGWADQKAFETVFGLVPRFAIASLFAYWAGEFTNSYTMARLKLATRGRHLWTRTIGSTISGQLVDSIFFILIAFGGQQPVGKLLTMVASAYGFKVAYEVVATPITYVVIQRLKRLEGSDVYDRGTNFNPFALS